jgi:hypothetical protein
LCFAAIHSAILTSLQQIWSGDPGARRDHGAEQDKRSIQPCATNLRHPHILPPGRWGVVPTRRPWGNPITSLTGEVSYTYARTARALGLASRARAVVRE